MGIIHLMLAGSRVDYFLWFLSNDSTARTKLVNVQANIKASKTVIQHHPLSNGDELTTLETPILLLCPLYQLQEIKG
ncbi:hypothetical protein [Mesobacillus zeae]|uniref:Uncharacterized protein n=1 Tax=Mesobacillus zeae TaxID=1917180 RepID=A0A398B9F7_9BACI|nr:hypothetical protein [Mesobacillus zeae]RID86749.1 hypothetical protein D1970_05695 [Mesobacillus zeae]